MYTWFGQVLSASIARVGNIPIAESFMQQSDKKIIPAAIKAIPLLDAGSTLMQIQRELWEKNLKDQRQKCIHCAESYTATAELHRIPVPAGNDTPIEQFGVNLGETMVIAGPAGSEAFAKWEGHRYNHILFRTPTLDDGIRYEKIAKNEVAFWRSIAYDCAIGFYYQEDENSEKEFVPDGYMSVAGKVLFNKKYSTTTLKTIREGLTELPSVRMFYEEPCPSCGQDTPLIAQVASFFRV